MIVKKNNEHKLYLTKALSAFPGISFAALPDPAGDSGTFLNMFFEDTAMAGKVVKQFNADGVTGFNYWYTNMYHFINQWDHLKGLKTAAKLPIHLLGAPQDYQKMSLAKSQEVVGRLVSFGIRVTWTKDELDSLVAKITKSVKAVQIA